MTQAVAKEAADYIGPLLIASIPYLLVDVLGDLAMLEGTDSHLRLASGLQLGVSILGMYDGRKHDLEFRVLINADDLYLRLRDDCRRFDLTERYSIINSIINPEDRTKNIGLRIVFEDADDVSYSSAFNMNNVCFRYSLRGAAEQEQTV